MPKHPPNCRRLSALMVLSLILLAQSTFAESAILTLDPARTDISFEVPATGHDVQGVVKMSSGVVTFDSVTGLASGEITIDASQAATDNQKRDKKMHTKVLESLEFPNIVFRPNHIEGKVKSEGSSDIELVGTLILLGKEHPLSMKAQVDVDNGEVTASASFPVPYIDWGLRNPSVVILRVGKVVTVQLTAVGTLRSEPGSTETGPGH